MICQPCKDKRHQQCPNLKDDELLAAGLHRPGTGLSPEGDRIQRSGQCMCQHRSKNFVKSDIGTEFVQQIDAEQTDFYEEDEPLEDLMAAFETGEKGVTQRP